jgi:DNA-binding MarR family transcriptional regulator
VRRADRDRGAGAAAAGRRGAAGGIVLGRVTDPEPTGSGAPPRGRHLDDIAEALPQRADAIARLFLAHTAIRVSRTEAGVLLALLDEPRRITELAASEGVTQPAMTLLINRLEARGWVARRPDPGDARAVLVTLTRPGRQVVDQLRAEYRALVHEEMATLADRDVAALARAVEVLDELIARLRERGL